MSNPIYITYRRVTDYHGISHEARLQDRDYIGLIDLEFEPDNPLELFRLVCVAEIKGECDEAVHHIFDGAKEEEPVFINGQGYNWDQLQPIRDAAYETAEST